MSWGNWDDADQPGKAVDLTRVVTRTGKVLANERLGGLLKHYHRAAA